MQDRRELLRVVHDALPEEKREQFDRLTPEEQWQHSMGWLRQARLRESDRRRPDQVSEQELEEFFVEEVDAATKEELLAMPRDKMQHQLRQLYRGNLPMRGWGMFGDQGERERGRRGPPPGMRERRGPHRFPEGPPRPPPGERPPN